MKNLNSNGFTTVSIPTKLRKEIKLDIKKIILKKLKIKENLSYKEISSLVSKLSEKNFHTLFGGVPTRYLSLNTGKKINQWINHMKYVNGKINSLHFLSRKDLKLRSDLNDKHYCVYFRCMRPNNLKKKISFVHRDYDFWKIETPYTYPLSPFKISKRHKLWIPIWGCTHQNYLRMIKKKQKKKIKVKSIISNKILKPQINLKENNILNEKNIKQPIKKFSKEAILFDDKVVHFAPQNLNKYMRISVEFTIISK